MLIADPERTPELLGPDRELLGDILRRVSIEISGLGTDEQVLHGEPHVGNLLRTREGLLFIDFETCCRGPVEFDIAHGLLPDGDGLMLPAADVCKHYPGANPDLIDDQCRLLVGAMITTRRRQRDDQLPNGHLLANRGIQPDSGRIKWIAGVRVFLALVAERYGLRSSRFGCGSLAPYAYVDESGGREVIVAGPINSTCACARLTAPACTFGAAREAWLTRPRQDSVGPVRRRAIRTRGVELARRGEKSAGGFFGFTRCSPDQDADFALAA